MAIETHSRTRRNFETQSSRKRGGDEKTGKPAAPKRADAKDLSPSRDPSDALKKNRDEGHRAHGFMGMALAPKLEMTAAPPVANFGRVAHDIGNAVTGAAAGAAEGLSGLKTAVDRAVGLFDPARSLPSVPPSSVTEPPAEKPLNRVPAASSESEPALFPSQGLTGYRASTSGTDENGSGDKGDSRASGHEGEAAGPPRKSEDGDSYHVSTHLAKPGSAFFIGSDGQVLGNLAALRLETHRNPKKLIEAKYDFVRVRGDEVSPGFYRGEIRNRNLDIKTVVGFLKTWESNNTGIVADFEDAYAGFHGKGNGWPVKNAAFGPAHAGSPALSQRLFSYLLNKMTYPGVKQQSKPVDIAIELGALVAPVFMLLDASPVTFLATIGLSAFSLPNLYWIKFRGKPIYRR